ncbi:MAG: acetyl-CoA carboxylase, carboxyltransferase subunit beta [Verrucomicrobiota bacterium]|nr:acetyl-CoA carboxylase, carboxyltransferase subunit beta [Verrucomicrobiota bacterium]
MANFLKPTYTSGQVKKRDIPDGLWEKCPKCGEINYCKELDKNIRVCAKCDHHNSIGAYDRIYSFVDPESFQEMDAEMKAVDILKFTGTASYTDKLEDYRKKTGLNDAVISGKGLIEGKAVGLAVMDFSFLAASMGSVVGEKITRTIELSTRESMPVIIISASGGARMYEGMLSLMQMAKTSGALARHAQANLPYISVLTNPTTAGVMASYASLGDVIIAEPDAMIGFAGPRVIKETTHQDLPKGFQTAEFLLERGLVDLIVDRREMRDTLSKLIRCFTENMKPVER